MTGLRLAELLDLTRTRIGLFQMPIDYISSTLLRYLQLHLIAKNARYLSATIDSVRSLHNISTYLLPFAVPNDARAIAPFPVAPLTELRQALADLLELRR
jgi:hypothetical protein